MHTIRNCLGGKLPFDQLPILEVDDKLLTQSTTIFKYVARETGWYEILDNSETLERITTEQQLTTTTTTKLDTNNDELDDDHATKKSC